jgi:hypothetical protein
VANEDLRLLKGGIEVSPEALPPIPVKAFVITSAMTIFSA